MRGEVDDDRVRRVLRGEDPFDEATMLDEDDWEPPDGVVADGDLAHASPRPADGLTEGREAAPRRR